MGYYRGYKGGGLYIVGYYRGYKGGGLYRGVLQGVTKEGGC